MGWTHHQGLHRLLCPSAAAGAARLLRWWGKVGMSSGSQAAGEGALQCWLGEGVPGGACSRSRWDSSLQLALTLICSLSSPPWSLPTFHPHKPALGTHPIWANRASCQAPKRRTQGDLQHSRRGFSLK